jgi:hypothetical protein
LSRCSIEAVVKRAERFVQFPCLIPPEDAEVLQGCPTELELATFGVTIRSQKGSLAVDTKHVFSQARAYLSSSFRQELVEAADMLPSQVPVRVAAQGFRL